MATLPSSPLSPEPLPPPPQWPKVIGTISIVWASLTIGLGLCGVGWMLATPAMMRMAEERLGPPPPELLPGLLMAVQGLVAVAWSGLLLWAGIATTLRRPWGRHLHLIWAPVDVVLTVTGIVTGLATEARAAEWAAANPFHPWAEHHIPGLGAAFALGCGVIGLVWPVFCLIWFIPRRHRPDAAQGEP